MWCNAVMSCVIRMRQLSFNWTIFYVPNPEISNNNFINPLNICDSLFLSLSLSHYVTNTHICTHSHCMYMFGGWDDGNQTSIRFPSSNEKEEGNSKLSANFKFSFDLNSFDSRDMVAIWSFLKRFARNIMIWPFRQKKF